MADFCRNKVAWVDVAKARCLLDYLITY